MTKSTLRTIFLLLFQLLTFFIHGFAQTGALDPTFNNDGIFTENISLANEQALSIVVQPNGKIIVTGNSAGSLLTRFNPDGTPDTEFESLECGGYNAIALQPDGKVVVAGKGCYTSEQFLVARYNIDGSFDSTFDGDGIATANLSEARTMVLQPDGKIVAAGYHDQNFVLLRFNPNGALDNSFLPNGIVETDFYGNDDAVYSLVVQPGGKVIAAGTSKAGSVYNFAVARYHSDGSADSSFSSDGKLIFTPDSISARCTAAALQSDGKILLAGYTVSGTNTAVVVVRLNEDGTPDTSFANSGILMIQVNNGNDYANSILVQPDDKILVGGYTESANGFDMMIIRCHPDGSPDTSFNSIGIATADFDTLDDFGYGLAIDTVNDDLFICGAATIGVQTDFAIAGFKPDGSPDNAFDSDGRLAINFGDGSDACYDVAVQPDGKIVLAGEILNGSGLDPAVMRLNPDGTRDSTFNETGLVIVHDDFNYSEAQRSLVLQNDGKIVVGGTLDYDYWGLFRLNPDGSPDSSFNDDGRVITAFNAGLTSLALQADGKIVAAGYCSAPISNGIKDWAITRYNSDGSLDSTFNGDGIVIFDYNQSTEWGCDVLVQPDGKIVVAGEIDNSSQSAGFIRLNPDGSPDSTFNGDGVLILGLPYYSRSIQIQTDGKLVFLCNNSFTLGTINSNGTLDASFGVQSIGIPGYTFPPFQIPGTRLNDFFIQPDGKYLMAATVNDGGSDEDLAFARFTNAGALDSAWGINGVSIYDIDSRNDIVRTIIQQPDGKAIACGSSDLDFMALRILTDINVGIADAEINNQLNAEVYPNPFSYSTSIRFSLEESTSLKAELFDVYGRKIKTIAEGNFSAGKHTLDLSAAHLSTGIYMLQIIELINSGKTNSVAFTRKIIIQ